ncbi:hypothetical protein GGS21DRAFT_487478 [Xylaria nigripes]|nr:hypothetical protein GGS21DRAFT_487478 [Xylaria nigripes]
MPEPDTETGTGTEPDPVPVPIIVSTNNFHQILRHFDEDGNVKDGVQFSIECMICQVKDIAIVYTDQDDPSESSTHKFYTVLPCCGHVFGSSCENRWAESCIQETGETKCPTCRKRVCLDRTQLRLRRYGRAKTVVAQCMQIREIRAILHETRCSADTLSEPQPVIQRPPPFPGRRSRRNRSYTPQPRTPRHFHPQPPSPYPGPYQYQQATGHVVQSSWPGLGQIPGGMVYPNTQPFNPGQSLPAMAANPFLLQAGQNAVYGLPFHLEGLLGPPPQLPPLPPRLPPQPLARMITPQFFQPASLPMAPTRTPPLPVVQYPFNADLYIEDQGGFVYYEHVPRTHPDNRM